MSKATGRSFLLEVEGVEEVVSGIVDFLEIGRDIEGWLGLMDR